jgi:hypothetical protein
MGDIALRARALLGSRAGAAQARSAQESSVTRTGPPDRHDAAAIAIQLRRAAAAGGADPIAASDAHLDAVAASLVDEARAALDSLENGAPAGSLSDTQLIALESVIRTRGRPGLIVSDDGLEALDDARHPGSGFWRIPVGDHELQLLQVAASSGAVMVRDRVNGGGFIVIGTAWLIKGNHVVTNRHVLLPPNGTALVDRAPNTPTAAALHSDFELVIDFAHHRGGAAARVAAIDAVPFIAQAADPIDVAILRLATVPNGTTPLTLATAAAASRQVFLVGHPALMRTVPKEVQAVFGTPDGRKRVCLGEVLADGALPGEIAHDASTIGGFSGACVQPFGGAGVSALHYYGDPARGNRAVSAGALQAHPVAAFL